MDNSIPHREVVLIDFSSIAVPIWKMSGAEPDPNAASVKMVARVRAIATGKAHVAVCCDSGKSFRHEINASYKANRPPADEPMHHQIRLAKEQLENDGFPIWEVKGFEADDLVASGVARALTEPDTTALIVSGDKDLLALVGPRVRQMRPDTGDVYDEAGVKAKLGVLPIQVRDYLTLVGDASDNIKGAYKVGAKTAAALLSEFGNLESIYEALEKHGTKFTPALATNLREFLPFVATTRELVTLRSDVPLLFDAIFAERVPKDAEAFGEPFDPDTDESDLEAPGDSEVARPHTEKPVHRVAPNGVAGDSGQLDQAQSPVPLAAPSIAIACEPLPGDANPSAPNGRDSGQPHTSSIAVREQEALPPAQWEMQLEPRSMRDARALAGDMHSSRLFSAYGHPAAILSTFMAGRELGLQAMASLRAFHIVEGKPTLAADLIRALVIRSGKAKFFRCVERTPERATFETQRGDDPPIRLSCTIEEATAAGRVKNGSGYMRDPADMLVARSSTKLARLVYPDVVHGLYSPEEME